MRNSTMVFCGVSVAAVGFFFAGDFRGNRSTLALTPPVVSIEEPMVVGQVADISLTLHNQSGKLLTITEAVSSCGCMDLLTKDGRELVGIKLAPKTSLPLGLSLSTEGKAGDREYYVAIKAASANGEVSQSSASIEIEVLSGLVPDPGTVVVRNAEAGSRFDKEVLLFSNAPREQIRIESVVSSDPDQMTPTLSKSNLAAVGSSSDFAGVYALKLNIQPKCARPTEQMHVRLQYFVKELPRELRIPVLCYRRPSSVQLSPEQLQIVRRDDEKITRIILCELQTEKSLRVLGKPDGVEVELTQDGPKTALMKIVLSPSDVEATTFDVVLGDAGGNELVRLPVTLSEHANK